MARNSFFKAGLIGLLLVVLAACGQPKASRPAAPKGDVLALSVSTSAQVQAVEAQVRYDPSKLKYLGVTKSAMLVADRDNGKGTVQLGAISSKKISGDLFTLEFKVKVPGAMPKVELRAVESKGVRTLSARTRLSYKDRASHRYDLQAQARKTVGVRSVPGPSALDPTFANYPLGDFDQNGNVTVADALGVLQVATGTIENPTDYQRYHSDLNSSGTISVVDAVIALRKAVDPDLEAGLEVAPQRMNLAQEETKIILVGNSGNQPLPQINVTAAPGLSVNDVTHQDAVGRVFQVSATDAVQNGAITFDAASAGTRVVAVNAAGSGGGGDGSGCPDSNEPNNDFSNATPITPGTLHAGICEANDVDYYTFTLNAPKVATLDVNAQAIGSALDSWMDLYDENGNRLAFNDDAGEANARLDSYMNILLPAGTYYVSISDFSQRGGSDYNYDLVFTLSDPDPSATYEAQAGTWNADGDYIFNGNLFELAGYTPAGDPLPYGILVNITAPNGISFPIPFNQPGYGKPGALAWWYIIVDYPSSGSASSFPDRPEFQPLHPDRRAKPRTKVPGKTKPIYVVSAPKLGPQVALEGAFTFDFSSLASINRTVDLSLQLSPPQNVNVAFNNDGTATVNFDPVSGAVEYTVWVNTETCNGFAQVPASDALPVTVDLGGCVPQEGETFYVDVIASDVMGIFTAPIPVPNQQIDVGSYHLHGTVTFGNTIRGTVSQGLPSAAGGPLDAPTKTPKASSGRDLPLSDRVVVLFDRTALRLPMSASATDVQAFAAEVRSFAADYGLQVLSLPVPTVGLAVFRTLNGDAEGMALRLKADARVKAAAPDYWRYPTAVPNDPYFGALWGMSGVINAPAAWETTTGDANVVVAVIDTGMGGPEHAGTSGDPAIDDLATRGYHEDLLPNLVAGYDFVSCYDISGELPPDLLNQYPRLRNLDADDQCGYDPYPIEEYEIGWNGDVAPWGSHGTHVSGTIGAVGNNAVGVAGVNWHVSIQMLRALGTLGGFSSDVLAAAAYAAGIPVDADGDPNTPETVTNPTPARVINMSLGGGGYSEVEDQFFSMLFNDYDVLPVAAAGNGATDLPSYPAAYPAVMSVASVDYIYDVDGDPTNGNRPAYAFTHMFSNYGPYIDLAAPGGICWNSGEDYRTLNFPNGVCLADTNPDGYDAPLILSTVWQWYDDADNRVDQPIYGFFAGTSMASPHVAGAAALLFGLDPSLTPYQVREIMRQTATDVDDSNLLGFGTPGRDDHYGWGVLNLARAVEAVSTGRIPTQPTGEIHVQAENQNTSETFTTIADDAGFYQFSQLPNGTYQVSAWIDVNGNGTKDAGEPAGSYPDPITLTGGTLAGNISFILQP